MPSGTVTRVPMKYLSGEKLTFTLVPKDKKETVIPVATDQPFAYLDKLDSARLQEADGQQEIIIDPVQGLQDSDLSQESPHILEQQ